MESAATGFVKNNKKVTWKEFARMLAVLATTASMVDTIMIGSEGEIAVAAVGVCAQIGSLLFSTYWGFVSCSLLFMSQYWGAKDPEGMNKAFGLAIICAGIFGIAFAVVTVAAPGWILGIYTDKVEIIALAKPYMRIVGWSYPLQVFAAIITALLKSTERVKVPLVCSVISLLLNFCINFVLIYGRFGAPKMGVAGAAIGTLVSGIVNIVLLILYLAKSRHEIKFSARKAFDIDMGFVKSYASKAFPIVCNEILYGVGQMIINVVMGHPWLHSVYVKGLYMHSLVVWQMRPALPWEMKSVPVIWTGDFPMPRELHWYVLPSHSQLCSSRCCCTIRCLDCLDSGLRR